jgi:hypothetical protein
MTKHRKRTERRLHYRALAEGYKILKPKVAESFQMAADYYDGRDPPIDPPPDNDKVSKDEHRK